MLLLKKSRIEAHTEDQIMSMAEGARELSALLPRIRQLARRPGDGRSGSQYATVPDDEDDDEEWDSEDDEDEDEEDYDSYPALVDGDTSDEDNEGGQYVLLSAEDDGHDVFKLFL